MQLDFRNFTVFAIISTSLISGVSQCPEFKAASLGLKLDNWINGRPHVIRLSPLFSWCFAHPLERSLFFYDDEATFALYISATTGSGYKKPLCSVPLLHGPCVLCGTHRACAFHDLRCSFAQHSFHLVMKAWHTWAAALLSSDPEVMWRFFNLWQKKHGCLFHRYGLVLLK